MKQKQEFPADAIEELQHCPYCNSKQFKHMFTENEFPYVECEECELIFLQTRVKEDRIDLIYNSDHYHDMGNINCHKMTGEKRLKILGKFSKNSRIHEDGAGNGAFALAAKNNGCKITCNDFGIDGIKKAKEYFDVDMTHGTFHDAKIDPGSLDVFVAFNLLSHLYSPWKYFQEVNQLLKAGGLILLRVGNREGHFRKVNWGKWSAPEHVYHYDVKLIKRMLSENGFEVDKVIPAFDSDYPYFLMPYSVSGKNPIQKVAHKFTSLSIRIWNLLDLPKDDVYILVKKL